jgi:hypothetical protein
LLAELILPLLAAEKLIKQTLRVEHSKIPDCVEATRIWGMKFGAARAEAAAQRPDSAFVHARRANSAINFS